MSFFNKNDRNDDDMIYYYFRNIRKIIITNKFKNKFVICNIYITIIIIYIFINNIVKTFYTFRFIPNIYKGL